MGQDWKDNTAHWHFAGIGFAALKVTIPRFDRFTAAALVFLDRNGSSIEAISGELSDLTLAVATGSAGKREIAKFFESHRSN